MTYFACVKAEITASKVDFAKKKKEGDFFDVRSKIELRLLNKA